MATQFVEKAKDAFMDDDFDRAVELYSKAIDLNPSVADFYADRAQAQIKLDNFTEAVADANKAIELDHSMVKAYLRKGIACVKLEEYPTARTALQAGALLAQDDSRFSKLIKECDQRIAEESDEVAKSLAPSAPSTSLSESVSFPQSNPVSLKKPKYRHEFYQKPDEVVLTIFARGIPANNVVVHFGEQILSVSIDVSGEDAYHFQPRLLAKIVPDKCRYQVLSTKIEIRLAKAESINWESLEYNKEISVPQKMNYSSGSSAGSNRPAYPSSKSRAKDWDRLEAQLKKEEGEEQLDGDAAVNKFFREIYQKGDEDIRRAMSKSFVESQGTVLSTDWKDVASKKIDESPPDGMELKKWEY